jgi:DeoR/GlpR family transcriptional regulator of sugar metabolism
VIAAQRRRAILRQVQDDGYVEASRLSADLGVDVSTIRRDLDSLARDGLVHRTHGGALPAAPVGTRDLGEEPRRLEHAAQKRAIATVAAGLVADGDAVALDAGSTTHALATALVAKKGLTVVTNDLGIAHELAAQRHVRLVVVGGELADSGSLVGPWAQQNLAGIHVDWAFLGADGIDANAGVTSNDTIAVPVKRAFVAAARATVVVADHSKFGIRALATVAGLDELDRVVTDDGLTPAQRAAYGRRLVCTAIDRVDSDTGRARRRNSS